MKMVQALGWYFPESLGGTEVYVAALSRRLQAAGYDVAIAAPDPSAARERSEIRDGIAVYRYPVPRLATREEAQGLVVARGAERFHDWLERRRPEVVHVHSLVTGLGLAEVAAAKARGARLYVTAHTPSLGWICQRGTMMRWGASLCDGLAVQGKCAACALHARGVPRPLARVVGAVPAAAGRLARGWPSRAATALAMTDLIARNQGRQHELLRLVDAFVVLTEWARRAVIANGAPADKVVLNRLGVAHDGVARKPGPDEMPTGSPIAIGYLGRFDPIMGVHDLARAAASLPRGLPVRVELRGPVASAAERACADDVRRIAGRDDRVQLAPAVPSAAAPAILQTYDVLCCPSVCLEGGPTVALEARAAGTPVIGTAIGGLAEMIADGVDGRLVAPGDWRALAAVLLDVAQNPRGTIDRWRAALPSVRTMDDVAADYCALYER
jgi:glycosyltransferase involved in cell wall biosynthesis